MQTDSASSPAAEGSLAAGARLRQAREMRGESVNEVSLALKLAPRQVEALESGRYEALPGLAFVRGFMRNYARYLGLDPAPLLAEVQARLGQSDVDLSPVSNAAGDLPTGDGRRSSSTPAGIVAALLLAVVLGGWYFDWFDTAPPVVEQELAPPMEGAAPAEVAPDAAPTVDAPPPLLPQAATAGGAASGATPPSAAPPGAVLPAAVPAAVAPADAAAASASPAGAAAGEPGMSQLAFRFTGQSWVEVRDAAGAILYSGTSAAGSTRSVQGRGPFALVVGNAAQVSLERDGQAVDLAPHTKGTVARLKLQ